MLDSKSHYWTAEMDRSAVSPRTSGTYRFTCGVEGNSVLEPLSVSEAELLAAIINIAVG